MKLGTGVRIALFGGLGAAACAWAPSAMADAHQSNLGSPVDVGGGQQWTVSGLQPSGDVLPYTPAGSLWEATATSQLAGGGIPVVPGFAAGNGADTYPVLWGVASATGINPGSLPPGGSTTGKIYFDVTGATPNMVTYTVDGKDVAKWVQPPPPPPASAGVSPYIAPSAPAPAAVAPAPAVTPATPPAATAPAPAATTPPPSGRTGTPLPAEGSTGTPLPTEGSSGTPLPADAPTQTPAPAATEATPNASPAETTPAAPTSPAATSSPAATTTAPTPAG